MYEIWSLTKRNCRVFFRDRTAVFFSLLSMLIVLMLTVVFLGRMNSENLVNMLAQYGGERDTSLDEQNAARLIQLWTWAGIMIVNAVTVTMSVIQVMVLDERGNKSTAFYVTPVKRSRLSLGYILAAWIAGSGMCFVTLLVGEIYFYIQGYTLLNATELVQLCGMILLNVFVYAALGYFLALLVRSASAWNGILTIIGTLVGFLGGIYLPMSMLSEKVQNVLKCLPVLHGASMMRQICTARAVSDTFKGLPEEAEGLFREWMGITLTWEGETIPLGNQLLVLGLYAGAAVVLSVWLNRRRRIM